MISCDREVPELSNSHTYKSVTLYDRKVSIGYITHGLRTKHMKKDRAKRFRECLDLNRCDDTGYMAGVNQAFDCVREDGNHNLCVITNRGILFIIDKIKFELGYPSVITVFPAKLSQVFYYYRQCGLDVPQWIIDSVRRWDDSVAGSMKVEGIDSKMNDAT